MESDIEEIVLMIWETLFELPLETSDDRDLTGGATVTSFVHIDGAWRGVVMLQCPMALASGLTRAMFEGGTDGSTDEVDEADVRDALGEIANMVAGNVKALLPEPCTISLPAVALGTDHTVSVPGTADVSTVSFTCDGRPFVITLLERRDGVKADA
jgi:chemotaxis protein CheX